MTSHRCKSRKNCDERVQACRSSSGVVTGNEEKEESSTFPVVAPAEVSDSIILGRGGKGGRGGGFSTSCQAKQVKECKHHACYRGNCSAFPPPSMSRAC